MFPQAGVAEVVPAELVLAVALELAGEHHPVLSAATTAME
jgi:hypothetical protein